MQREPIEVAKRWLAQADADLAAGQRNRESAFLACFLAQQSAEKALKGLLQWSRGDHQRIHLIASLLDECALAGPVPEALDAAARTLDKYYTTTRYPDALDYALPAESFSVREADEALRIAGEVASYVRKRLDEEQ